MTEESPQLRMIRERYRNSFPEKIVLLTTLLEGVENGDDLDTARQELHKLAGSSGMYGYQEIALLCRTAMSGVEQGARDLLVRKLGELIELIGQQA